jgi:tetratricopeptide (TPR) repeat protein
MGAGSEPPGDIPIMPAAGTSAVGSGSVAIARDVDRSAIVTGKFNVVYQYFVQHYPSLKDYIYNFDDEKELAEGFVGREELFGRLDGFAERRPCGYFRVVADSGLGKTALAAVWAKKQEAPVFFANASYGRTQPGECLKHLAAELIGRFGLDHDHLPDRAGKSSDFLRQVLGEAAARAKPRLWIIIDALDEADPPGPGRNPLLLPERLPDGVYILLTHRPGEISLNVAPGTANEAYRIMSNDANQRADIAAYLRREADRPEIRRAREAVSPPITIDEFVEILQSKSEGNFKYLEYVLEDVRAQELGFVRLELESLPSGLRGYYQQFFRLMEPKPGDREGWVEWDGFFRPVIVLMAAAREPVPASWLAAMLGHPAEEIEQRALKLWLRFLSQDDRGREDRRRPRRWRVVHQSIADSLDEEDAGALRAAHDRVATFYLSAWGGLDAGLPTLFDPARREELDDYGRRHLAEHLERAGRVDELHRLLRLERRIGGFESGTASAENAWYVARERVGQTEGYMNDLARAARLVQVPDKSDVEPSRSNLPIGLGIRYALMATSLRSLAWHIPPALIAALVEKRVWLASQGVAYARLLPPMQRIEALLRVGSQLDYDEREAILREARDTARGIGHVRIRSHALESMVRRLVETDHISEALEVTREIEDVWVQACSLVSLAPRLADASQVDEALAVTRAIELGWVRAYVLAALGKVDEALVLARGVESEEARAQALESMAPHLVEEIQVEEVMALGKDIGDEGARARTLSAMAPRLAALGHVDRALILTQAIGPERVRANAVAGLAPLLGGLGQVDRAIEMARAISDEGARATALAALALRLAALHEVDRAIAIAWNIRVKDARARALAGLATGLARAGRLGEALPIAREIGDERVRAVVLAELGQVREALTVARAIGNERLLARAHILADLTPYLMDADRLAEALALARGIRDDEARARARAEIGRMQDTPARARGITDEAARIPADVAQVDEELARAREIKDERDRSLALAPLALRLAEVGRLDEALAVTPEIGDDLLAASVLAGLIRRLAASGRVDHALALAREIRYEMHRTGALRDLAPRLAALPKERALALWRDTLQFSATRSRRDLLADLVALAPLIVALGGPEAIEETCRAIEDVGRWWP